MARRLPVRAGSMLLLTLSLASLPSRSQNQPPEFARAEVTREFDFPADHASHPEFATEWWYLTGNLTTPDGDLFGFQATWFRNALAASIDDRPSDLAVRDVILFHAGLTDVRQGSFHSASRVSRAASSWAGAEADRLDVWLHADRLSSSQDGWTADFRVGDWRLELELAPTRDPLLHGAIPGLSQKGPESGQASYYYSQSRLEVKGSLRREPEGPAVPVQGRAWFDHEFFSRQLAETQVGWDWFSVALDDGTDLMVFQLRDRQGGRATTSAGTLRFPDGDRRHLAASDFELEVTDTWTSPAAREEDEDYPSRWVLSVPSEGLRLQVEPLVADQEHRDEAPGAMSYWEGLSRFKGTRAGQPVEGLGYVELVGYRGAGPSGL